MNDIKSYLEHLGLSDYEARVYYCLLQGKHLSATELANATEIRQTKIYSVIQKLEKKHFCVRVPGNDKIYKATNPINPIYKQIGILQKQIDQMDQAAEILNKLYIKNNNDDNMIDYIEVVKDRDLIVLRTEQLESLAKKEVRCLLKSPFIMPSDGLIQSELVFNEGVKYISIYDEKELEYPDLVRVMQKFQAHGVEVRTCKSIPVKIAIFDDKAVLVNTKDKISNSGTSTAIISQHEDLVRAFSDLFEFYFAQSNALPKSLPKGLQ
ncbi:MAG: helix-turn-helix domain-containing protein [Candidatus Cloacimonadaceae bacterium]|nr:hypothetical protein [Candidatus Cloacimonadota bacterium]MDY0128376.1 helix-turn-helix domain-containing protein [Candidatus Cloacimonadaceae bacterium]MCB5254169.1 hypothetical protein [Candidatus Cloacimonadota bacterium]MCK9178810.1 hypothetical protein [Candidatus Cloacimonadota bacterium]MCK9242912.1 hypothetical protein [Candidatus Cloacimonadota bacterium]